MPWNGAVRVLAQSRTSDTITVELLASSATKMIAKTIRQTHPHPRPVHFATERTLSRVPGLDMLLTKAGGNLSKLQTPFASAKGFAGLAGF